MHIEPMYGRRAFVPALVRQTDTHSAHWRGTRIFWAFCVIRSRWCGHTILTGPVHTYQEKRTGLPTPDRTGHVIASTKTKFHSTTVRLLFSLTSPKRTGPSFDVLAHRNCAQTTRQRTRHSCNRHSGACARGLLWCRTASHDRIAPGAGAASPCSCWSRIPWVGVGGCWPSGSDPRPSGGGGAGGLGGAVGGWNGVCGGLGGGRGERGCGGGRGMAGA